MQRNIPDFLEQMLIRQYGNELADTIIAGYDKRRPVTFRVNTLKADTGKIEQALTEAGIRFWRVSWNRDALILEDVLEPEIRQLDIYENGEIYLQSLSSMIPPILLDPQEKECILDMAAAPGGKTTQMAALSGNQAQITACEKNQVRSERLKYNLEKQGATRVSVMNVDARKLDPFFSFDKILLDAPCSGSGTLNAGKTTKELIVRSAKTQEELLRKALQLLKPGREMIYSTCSILEEENEKVLRKVLPQAKAEIVPLVHPMFEEIPLLPTTVKGTYCICPDELYEGFFVAKIRKK